MTEQQLLNKVNIKYGGYVKRGWLREAIRRGEVKPAVKAGQRYLYDAESLDQIDGLLKVTA